MENKTMKKELIEQTNMEYVAELKRTNKLVKNNNKIPNQENL